MDLLKGVALFIGWVTSSFAGIGAILYACGYLVSRAQLRVLGLFGLFDYSADYYLQEGANFFVLLVLLVVEALAPWLLFAGYALLALLVLSIPLDIIAWRRPERVRGWGVRLGDRARALVARRPWAWRAAAFLALFIALIFHVLGYLNQFSPALEISNLLYPPGATPRNWEPVRGWIVRSQRSALEEYFRLLLWATVQAGVLLALASRLAGGSRWRVWLLAPFVVVFMMYTLFLPMAYGGLVRPLRFAVVHIAAANPAPGAVAGEYFLLNKTAREFILWDKQARRVVWLPNERVGGAVVSEVRALFDSDPQPGKLP